MFDNTAALLNALRDCEQRLTLLIEREQHKLLDVLARDNARNVIARVEAEQAKQGDDQAAKE